MDLAQFDYELPDELIAQEPPADRAGGRMLVVYREEHRWEDRAFRDFPSFLGPGDCLVLNDSRVFPARLFGHRAGVRSLPVGKNNPKRREYLSGRVEVFLLRAVSADGRDWEALVRPGRKMRLRERIEFEGGLEGEIVGRGELG
jgi:S-adenosylmethionine:tRNA ribosyltransferase-isomerase